MTVELTAQMTLSVTAYLGVCVWNKVFGNGSCLMRLCSEMLRLTFQNPVTNACNSSFMAVSNLKRDTWLTYSS